MAHKSRLSRASQDAQRLQQMRARGMRYRPGSIMAKLEVSRMADYHRQNFNNYIAKHAEKNAEFLAEMDQARERIERKYVAYRDRRTHDLSALKKIEREIEIKQVENQIRDKYHNVPSMRELFSVFEVARLATLMTKAETMEKRYGVHIIDANQTEQDSRPYWKKMIDNARTDHPEYEKPTFGKIFLMS